MTDRKPAIIFMGTPKFAVPSLEILIKNNFPVKAVVTSVDKPSGRGLKVRESAVKQTAVANGIPVLQPSNLKDDQFAWQLREFKAELFVVVAFRILPVKIWSIPPLGTVNLHASLLPAYRGAAPINHAIINGEKITGVTTFLIEKDIDTGQILFREKTGIADDETAGSLHDRLMILGATVLLKTVMAMTESRVQPLPQAQLASAEPVSSAPRITKNDCRIDWSNPADRIYDFVRGLSPQPAAWTSMTAGDKTINLKILEVEKKNIPHSFSPGCIMDFRKNIEVAAGRGSIILKYLKAEGRKAMTGSEFLRGFRSGKNIYFR